jgi:hypothetical protein
MITAQTTEVDEVEDALNEILGQIDLGTLEKNTVGLITCHFDFTDTGFIDELCRKLPFDVIGMTTMASANRHGYSMYALSLTILTSDDVIFETAIAGRLCPDDYREKIGATYSDTMRKLPGRPSLIITFFPYLNNLSGARMYRALDDICEGVPFWGSIATNTDVSYERCSVFRNGDVRQAGLVMALLYGPVDPEFVVVSIPTQNIQKIRGRITDSDGCVLKEINGIPVMKYLENIGVVIMKDASITIPLMVYHEGSSTPIAAAIYAVNDDGSLLCGSEMPKGASIAVGEITNEGIAATAVESVTRLLECGRRNGALILPCVTRYIMQAANHNGEIELIADRLENGKIMPYMVGYSGGELCPVRDESGILRNRFHGFTFSACVL